MKILVKLSATVACFLCAAPAMAGDLVLTAKWAAQNPPWTSTTDTHVDLNSEVLTAWRSISGNNGPMCQAVWNNLGPGLSGAGNCIRNLYNTGNTCSFDQNPAISVDSRNNTATITLHTSNNQLRFTTSVQGVCNVVNTGVLFEALYSKCLEGQTAGKLPGTDETVCLNNADWLKVNVVVKACVAPGKVEAKCPAASERGPKPPDGWFGNGSCMSCACASPRQWNPGINACELRLNVH